MCAISCIELKIKLNFYFHTSLWWSKGFMKAFKAFIKPFDAPQRSVKIKIWLHRLINLWYRILSRFIYKLTGVGWPSKSLSIFLRFNKSASSNKPAKAHAAYRIGALCPYVEVWQCFNEKTNIVKVIYINFYNQFIMSRIKLFNVATFQEMLLLSPAGWWEKLLSKHSFISLLSANPRKCVKHFQTISWLLPTNC